MNIITIGLRNYSLPLLKRYPFGVLFFVNLSNIPDEFLLYVLVFFDLEARMLAIAPVIKAIAPKSAVFRVKYTLPSRMEPIINESSEYINAVIRLETRLLSGLFLAAMVLPAKTPNIVAAMADGSVYISGKSVKQSNKAAIRRIMKVTARDATTDFIMLFNKPEETLAR